LAGAALAQSAAPREKVRAAAAIGAIAALLPDADVFFGSSTDPLRGLEVHRHFTHALVLAPLGALLLAAAAWPLLRRRLRFVEVFAFALVGLGSAGLLDACTSFGTYLFLPFSEERVAWNLLAIVDPLFSVALVAGVAAALRRRSAVPARIAVALALAYLAVAVVQRERATALAWQAALERGHEATGLVVKPTMGNILLWRSVYVAEDSFHVAAVRPGLLGEPRVYPGGSAPRVIASDLELPRNSVMARDIVRFEQIAEGYLVRHPRRPDVLGDARYAMLPNGTAPLWGIVVDASAPERHVALVTMRDMDAALRRDFVSMLLGRDGSQQVDRKRAAMLREQLQARHIRDERVLDAMRTVPRHLFVPEQYRHEAYADTPLPIGRGQTISQPYMVAFMAEALQLRGSERVLEVGSGSGYAAAVLSLLAAEVYGIELEKELYERSVETIRELGYRNVHLRSGDGFGGWPQEAPFDAIVVSAAAETLPEPLWEQLAEGGRIVYPRGRADAVQELVLVTKTKDGRREKRLVPVRFVPLRRP
jgi:inner membrane protein